jgi:metal-responsive CopG/Arc/MetJ family transcriptional regulator
VISVSVERELLARSDRLVRKLGISRAELIARGLQATLASVRSE